MRVGGPPTQPLVTVAVACSCWKEKECDLLCFSSSHIKKGFFCIFCFPSVSFRDQEKDLCAQTAREEAADPKGMPSSICSLFDRTCELQRRWRITLSGRHVGSGGEESASKSRRERETADFSC